MLGFRVVFRVGINVEGGLWNFRLFVGFGLSVGGWILIRR